MFAGIKRIAPDKEATLVLKERASRDPFYLIEKGFLTIKTKTGEMVPFVLNKAQQKLHDIIKKLWFEKKIIRLLILKGRQLGCSTYFEGLIYALTSQKENINATIIADDLDGSNYIFEMSKLFHEKIDPTIKPAIKKSNEKKLEFDGTHSQIIIDTAENPDAGRKYTFRAAHLSEYAYFSHADRLMLGLSQAVPALPQTIIIKETTANGFNFFRDEWEAASNGENDWIPIFIPWYWGDDYVMPVDDTFQVGDPALGDITKDEFFLRDKFAKEGIDRCEERLQWRRWCIKNNCGGSVQAWNQEYPATPLDAFVASGQCFFDKEMLAQQLYKAKEPLFRADIVKVDFIHKLRISPEGQFEFYEKPGSGEKYYGQYAIGGDACSGSGADYAVLCARDKETRNVVATFRGKVDSDELAEKAALLGGFLNNAIVGIENDKFGFAANIKLKQIYARIYHQRIINRDTAQVTEKFGWETTGTTRPAMLNQLQEEIREGAIEIRNKVFIKECLTFIMNPETKRAEAQEGTNDDCVLAMAIAGMLIKQDLYKPPVKRPVGRNVSNMPANAGLGFRK